MDVVVAGSTLTRLYNTDELARTRIELSADATEVGAGTFVLPDPNSDDNVFGGRQFKVSEGTTLITDGFVGVQVRERGINPVQPSVEATYTVYDANALLHGKRMSGWNRGAETDKARILARAALDIPDADTTWVLDTNTETMAAKTYTTVGWDELMRDVFEYTGKTVFLHDLADGSGRCLHSHKETEGHPCGLEITDDLSVADGVTAFLPTNPQRNRSSQELINNVLGRDQAGRTAISTDAGSITDHDADGLRHQGIADFQAASQADLQAKTDAYIVETADEIDIYSCVIGPLDEDALALIRVGDRIDVDSQAMDFTGTIRIAHIGLVPRYVDGIVKWDADLELGEAIRERRRVTSGVSVVRPPSGAPPFRFIGGSDTEGEIDRGWIVGTSTITTDKVTSDTENVAETFIFGTGIFVTRDPDGSDQEDVEGRLFIQQSAPPGAGAGRFRTRLFAVALAADGTPIEPLNWKIWQGQWTVEPGGSTVVPRDPNFIQDPFYSSRYLDGDGLPVVLASGSLDAGWFDAAIPLVTNDMPDFTDLDIVVPVVDGKFQLVLGFDTQLLVNIAGGDVTMRHPNITNGVIGQDVLAMTRLNTVELNDAYQNTGYSIDWLPSAVPALGQWVLKEVPTPAPDGATSSFALLYPYFPGSLRVRVDGIWQNVVEDDPVGGLFDLNWTPDTGDEIEVDYMGAG